MIIAIFSILVVFLLWRILLFYWYYFTNDELPPGPFPYPFLGNLHLIRSSAHVSLAKIAAKYGGLMSVYFGSELVVVVSSSEMAREVLVRQSYVFGGRPLSLPYGAVLFSHGGKNIAFRESMTPRWKKQRKIFRAALKSFGSGLLPLEKQVNDVVEDLIMELDEHTDIPLDISRNVFLCVANIICAITFGSKYKHDDQEFTQLMKTFDTIQQSVAPGSLIDVITLLRQLPLGQITKLKSAIKLIDSVVSRHYSEHSLSINEDDIRDMTDALVKVYRSDADETTTDDVRLTNEEIKLIINDIFFAGIETTVTSILWGIFRIASHPHIQDEIYNEMRQNLEPGYLPSFSDRHRLPFLLATITEVFRCGSVVPLLLPHRTVKDAFIRGFRIPKDTTVLVNAWAIHNDAQIWGDPQKFKPARFLNEKGTYLSPPPFSFYPFSAGKRVCVGEILGKMVVYVIIARILREFRLALITERDSGAEDAQAASIRKPKPFKVVLKKRS